GDDLLARGGSGGAAEINLIGPTLRADRGGVDAVGDALIEEVAGREVFALQLKGAGEVVGQGARARVIGHAGHAAQTVVGIAKRGGAVGIAFTGQLARGRGVSVRRDLRPRIGFLVQLIRRRV